MEYRTTAGERLVTQGAQPHPTCPVCRNPLNPAQSAKIRVRRLVHLACDDIADVARALGQCSVCETPGFRPWELDGSGRCDECRP